MVLKTFSMKTITFCTLLLTVIITGCSPTPESLARQSRSLHEQLSNATTEADSDSIFREISYIETRARRELDKKQFKEYARQAHGDGTLDVAH